jgi:hypothetical protein
MDIHHVEWAMWGNLGFMSSSVAAIVIAATIVFVNLFQNNGLIKIFCDVTTPGFLLSHQQKAIITLLNWTGYVLIV